MRSAGNWPPRRRVGPGGAARPRPWRPPQHRRPRPCPHRRRWPRPPRQRRLRAPRLEPLGRSPRAVAALPAPRFAGSPSPDTPPCPSAAAPGSAPSPDTRPGRGRSRTRAPQSLAPPRPTRLASSSVVPSDIMVVVHASLRRAPRTAAAPRPARLPPSAHHARFSVEELALAVEHLDVADSPPRYRMPASRAGATDRYDDGDGCAGDDLSAHWPPPVPLADDESRLVGLGRALDDRGQRE